MSDRTRPAPRQEPSTDHAAPGPMRAPADAAARLDHLERQVDQLFDRVNTLLDRAQLRALRDR